MRKVCPGLLATAVMVVAAMVLAACTTVATRIEEHSALFASLDPATQHKLRNGQVELGYTMTMAYIAFGSPDLVRRTTRAEGESLTWLYQYSYPVYDGYSFAGYHHHFVQTRHGVRLVHIPTFRERYYYETRDYLRLTFEGGRLTQIERTE